MRQIGEAKRDAKKGEKVVAVPENIAFDVFAPDEDETNWQNTLMVQLMQMDPSAFERLAGKIKRPRRKPGAKPKVNENQIICRVISILKRYANIPPKRNEASDGFSGSDVVAEGLQRSGIKSQTPRGVAKIWRRHGKGFR